MYAATMTGFSDACGDTLNDVFAPNGDDFYVRVLLGSPIPETETNDEDAPRSAALQRLGGRVIGPATAKPDSFAITVNGRDTIGVIVAVDLERGVPVWNVIAGIGV